MTETKGVYQTETEEAMEMLGKGYGHQVKDESNDRKYFIITPRIVKAYSRTPHDLALWDTIKDIAGESGECYLNTEQLAILSGMSMGKASESRKYWISIGFLRGEVRKDPGYPQPVWHLTVPDLWQKNIEWCELHPKIQDRIDFMMDQKSLQEVKPSPGEEGPTPREEGYAPGETKKNYKKKEKEENGASAPNPDLVDGILKYQKPTMTLITAVEKFWQFNVNWETKTARQWLEWAHGEEITPEQIEAAAKAWKMDKKFNWRPPSLKLIFECWPALMEATQPKPQPKESEYKTL